MDASSSKQSIVEKIKNVTNILVTVSADPTVDELTAALGLTIMLNKMEKHATAVFSGAIPPAIKFLEPEKTLIACETSSSLSTRKRPIDCATRLRTTWCVSLLPLIERLSLKRI